MDQQQFEARLQQIEITLDERLARALQGTAGDVQKAIDAMGIKWQQELDASLNAVMDHARQENAKAVKSALFTGLFEQNAKAFLDAVDSPSARAPQLQRHLYDASDAAVAGLNHGPTVRFHHMTDIEFGATVATSALVGIGLRALAVRAALYLKQRRERKEQEAASGLSQI